ncbi:MAG: tetratricopeptide repeat protein [Bacteroidales bacterium]|nr:tetratricopeptide repeat protein [Bacteroidales bacterium]
MKKSVIIIVLIFSFTGIFAQNSTDIIKAFKTSYSLEKEGEYKKAADELKKVYSDDSYEINLRIAWLLYNSGLFDESAAHYQKALNLKPYSEEAKFGLIYPKAAQGKWTEVINIYNKILEISPNNTIANYRLGLILYGQKNYTKAASYFEKVLDLYPFDYDALLMMAWTDYSLGKMKEAKILFTKVLMNSPGNESATEGIGLIK